MSAYLYGAFVLACVVLAATPGPSMALFIANSASHGTRAGLLTVLGNGLGLSILVAAATLGMTSVMVFVAEWFDVIRWLGAAYLVWLGIWRFRAALQSAHDMPQPAAPGNVLWRGFIVALSNPKVLLFLGAFFPQFLDPAAAIAPQLALLAVTFVIVIVATDALMVLALGTARGWFLNRRNILEGFSGSVLVVGGIWLALARRA
ncbi:LysE family translocator [Dichotomicrobium thermohalophilum]|uniref:Threonine/homoserine/homoserine lactone efflux protein n=1 Tax=Dichotomicrobium thermohalophilum TaxID=933063 RepID=A0A397QFI5_9HYPH|nr:LysE family translocator [Dichotomicrobium thermohalophilum]RIA56814.1 threonine/homoserine/homoserine lactone efflux protein [Dichotomicrobium thermohalophilum]